MRAARRGVTTATRSGWTFTTPGILRTCSIVCVVASATCRYCLDDVQRRPMSEVCGGVIIADADILLLFRDERNSADLLSCKGLPEQLEVLPTLRQYRVAKELQGRL